MTPAGFSHSELSGSKPVCDSPELFAANYVLHRHLTPRHPSCALSSLTANFCEVRGPRENLLDGGCHHQLSRHAVSGSRPSLGSSPHTKPDPCGGSGGCGSRSRSKLAKRATLSGFHRRSFSNFSRHAFASSSSIGLVKERSWISRSLTYSLLEEGNASVFDTVERKGFEPSTPGLQSRCSPS